ncbi:MAG TPA: tetratricopeptide repeat protein [Terriglobia bacterium]|nr:tetratricopeptide repeat protein [Terriglobia bacterium]
MARARLTRSELKSRDEITSTLERLTETAITRKNEVFVAAAIVLAVLGAFFGWRYFSNSRNAAAQKELSNVILAFHDPGAKAEKERFEKTILAAQKAMADHPSSSAASLAQYYLALSQDGLGDMPNAVKNLEEVIGRGDVDTKPVAQFALAGVYKRNGDFQKAIAVLKQLESSGGYSKAAVSYELGTVAEAANQKDVAQAAYSKVITDSVDSPFRTDAESALKRMGLPVPVPAPPQVEVK